jgi:hypothetical protein
VKRALTEKHLSRRRFLAAIAGAAVAPHVKAAYVLGVDPAVAPSRTLITLVYTHVQYSLGFEYAGAYSLTDREIDATARKMGAELRDRMDRMTLELLMHGF